MQRTPICYDLFCGLGGWAEGFLAEGYRVIGYDIEAHDYGAGGYPRELRLRDVLTIHGSEFKDATVIVASPPCQKFSYMAMPWSKAKALIAYYEASAEARKELTALFDACFRIQREAIEAAGRHIPLIVENVRGAQRWVGRAKANFGSFYLWGDVGMVGRRVVAGELAVGAYVQPTGRSRKTPLGSWDTTRANYNGDHKWNPDGTEHPPGSWFKIADSKNRGARSEGCKSVGMNWSDQTKRGQDFTRIAGQQNGDGVKGFTPNGEPMGKNVLGRKHGSKSPQRKAASAMIAKIPFPLAQHIARSFLDSERAQGYPQAKDTLEGVGSKGNAD